MIVAIAHRLPHTARARAPFSLSAFGASGSAPTPRQEVPFQDTWKSDDPARMAVAEARDKVREQKHMQR